MATVRPRVLLCEFSQESNSFNPIVWDMARFQSMLVARGPLARAIFSRIRSPIQGMMAAIRERGGRAILGSAFRATSGGPVDGAVVRQFIEETTAKLRAGKFDAVFLSLHGATISTENEDACGQILRAVRAAAGKETVISVGCDMHANITEAFSECADFICGFRTYPHVDFYETGYRAASLGMRALAGEQLYQSIQRVPMIVPASGYSSGAGAFHALLEKGESAMRLGEVEDFTVFQMQPWLDVAEAASCAVAISSSKQAAAQCAERLAEELYSSRAEFWPNLMSLDEIVRLAANNAEDKPIILADAADSPNAGAPGDSISAILALLRLGTDLRALTFVCDPAAAGQAHKIGVGGSAIFSLGAAFTPGIEGPVALQCRVHSLHSGAFRLAGPAGKGMKLRMGKTAVLQSGALDILVCETPGGSGDLNFYRAFGVDPADYQLVVVKANTSFREGYAPISAQICVADAPGAASANLASLPYTHIPKGMYPFCDNNWRPAQIEKRDAPCFNSEENKL